MTPMMVHANYRKWFQASNHIWEMTC
jgi:hypothetical protein